MATFSDRLVEHCTELGLRQVDTRAILEKAKQTVSDYWTGKLTPDYSDLIKISATLGPSLDWVTGLSSHPRWNQSIIQMRAWLPSEAQGITADTWPDRVVKIVRLIQEQVPTAKQDWFMAGVLGFHSGRGPDANAELFHRFMSEAPAGNDLVVKRLADFTGLPSMWIYLGDAKYLNRATPEDMGEWVTVLDEYIRLGHTAAAHRRYVPYFNEIYQREERLRTASENSNE